MKVQNGEWKYNSVLCLTSALDGGGWSTLHPGRFTPGNDTVHIVQEAGWALGPVWTGAENLAASGVRSPDRQARSESLYRLSYPGLHQAVDNRWKITTDIAAKLRVCTRNRLPL